MPFLIVQEEILDADWLPPQEFLASTVPTPWHEQAIVILWSVLSFGYLLFMAPILLPFLVFWIVAVEWSLGATLGFASDTDFLDDDDSNKGRSKPSTKTKMDESGKLGSAPSKNDAPPLIHADVHEWN